MAAKQLIVEKNSSSTSVKFPLIYDCVWEVFQWLNFDDCMNFAEAYDGHQQIADRIYKRKFNNLTIDCPQTMNRILYHAGPSAKTLKLMLNNLISESDLMKIGETCKELRCLTLNHFDRKKFEKNPFVEVTSELLEELTLAECNIENDQEFFDVFKNLKCLNLSDCIKVADAAIKKCFDNNQHITSFTLCRTFFNLSLLQFLPTLERLMLKYDSRIMNLDSLSKLPSLRHLTLHCSAANVNSMLAALAKINILEQLELINVDIDDSTFRLIKSLEQLQMLAVTTMVDCPFPASDKLPAKLKTLKLGGVHLVKNDIASAVKKLHHLRDINLQDCEVVINDYVLNDFESIADFILDELAEQRDRQLNIAVQTFEDEDEGETTEVN